MTPLKNSLVCSRGKGNRNGNGTKKYIVAWNEKFFKCSLQKHIALLVTISAKLILQTSKLWKINFYQEIPFFKGFIAFQVNKKIDFFKNF